MGFCSFFYFGFTLKTNLIKTKIKYGAYQAERQNDRRDGVGSDSQQKGYERAGWHVGISSGILLFLYLILKTFFD